MAKVSKNARVAQRAANAGSGRDFVKVIKSIKDPVLENILTKSKSSIRIKVKEFFEQSK